MSSAEGNETVGQGALLEHVEYKLPSVLETVEVIEQAAEQIARRAGFDDDTATNIAMVTREAAINAAKHGNGFVKEKIVTAVLERTSALIRICISDTGPGLDPDTLPDPLDPANLLRSSGRGVFLMRAIMDEVHFRQLQPGTEITLIKRTGTEANS